jgi:hypothetical protein
MWRRIILSENGKRKTEKNSAQFRVHSTLLAHKGQEDQKGQAIILIKLYLTALSALVHFLI